jgi:hypothetical protein
VVLAIACFAVKAVELAFAQFDAARGGQPLDHHKPGVMAGAAILIAGISQPDHQPSNFAAPRRRRVIRRPTGRTKFVE